MKIRDQYLAQTKAMTKMLADSFANTAFGSQLMHFAHYGDSYDDKSYDDGRYMAYVENNPYDDYTDYSRYDKSIDYDDQDDRYYD